MSLRLTRSAMAIALAASCLVTIPACKKKKPPTTPDPDPAPANPTPQSPPSMSGTTYGFNELPAPPRGPLVSATFEAPFRDVSQKNLRQIMLAMHEYHNAHQGLPGGFADKNGKPGLSWRVALLPQLGHEPLYKQFKLDEPWDSPNNKKLIGNMPAVYSPTKDLYGGYTFYRGFTGPGTWLPPRQGVKPGAPIPGVKLLEITDGASNTILVAEAADAVIWTKPEELPFTPGNAPKLGGVFSSGFTVGMADGSARFVRKNSNPSSVANAIDINGGIPVDLDY